jgi:hypothetical protein
VTATDAGRREAALAFLGRHDAAGTPHLFGDLLTHLLGTEALVRRWGGSERLALAALGHATYGTDGFEPYLLPVSERAQLAVAIGDRAEALVYFYASCDRDAFYPQLVDEARAVGDLTFRDRFTGDERRPEPEQVTLFVDLTYANEGELAASSPGGPAEWTWLADFRRQTERWASPGFADGLFGLVG